MRRLSAFVLVLAACASKKPTAPVEPAWVTQPTRTVDSGYIVYIGHGEDAQTANAQFKAEGAAFSDVANECSFVPKGARVEDRYQQDVDHLVNAYAKVALTFEECEAAKKAVDPESIRNLANVAIAEQLKRYQSNFYDTPPPAPGATPDSGSFASSAGGGGGGSLYVYQRPVVINDTASYVIVQQQIYQQKMGVILAPPTAYPPGAPQTTQFVTALNNHNARLHEFAVANPGAAAPVPWSYVQHSPAVHEAGVAHLSPQHTPVNPRMEVVRPAGGGGGRGGGQEFRAAAAPGRSNFARPTNTQAHEFRRFYPQRRHRH